MNTDPLRCIDPIEQGPTWVHVGCMALSGIAMRNLMLAVLMLACSPPMQAGQLYRCEAAGGAVSYQARACAAGTRMTRTIDYVAQPDSVPAAFKPAAKGAAAASRRRAPRYSGAATRPVMDSCAQAKASREAELERLGLRRTYDDLSRIDAKVRRACRGY